MADDQLAFFAKARHKARCEVLKAYCSRALVLHHGRGNLFDDIDLAMQVYNDL